jgi:hypothetical protein
MPAWLAAALSLALGAAPVPNPDVHARLALAYRAAAVAERDRPYVRFLSFWDTPAADLWDYRRFLAWWCQQLSFERAVTLPREVPGTGGRLVWVDMRWYGWNAKAWAAVARRDPFAREPWVFHRGAEELRRGAGYHDEKPVRDGTRAVLTMVRASWFLRETLETRKSPSYYDLLFAKFRFPGEWYWWPGGRGPRDTQDFPAGWYTAKAEAAFVDFPADVRDWERAFGIDVVKTFGKGTKIDLDFGAVVAGGRDHPGEGSIVALNNRLVVTLQGPFGVAMRTFDVNETSGDRDYSETLMFKGGKFVKGDGADAVFDAGELLAYLPNGGQAGLLIDGQGKRVEVAGGDVANDTFDKRMNAGVRNYGSCVTCHAGAGGFIPPKDVEDADKKAGIKRKFKDKDQELRYRAFFGNWQRRIKGYAEPYEELVAEAAALPPAKPWTGSDVAKMVGRVRDDYDGPVTAARGARELGLPEAAFKYLCSRSPKHRLNQLVQGRAVPSSVWEKDACREVGLLLDAYRKDPEYERLFGGN